MKFAFSWSLEEMRVWLEWGCLEERRAHWQNPWAFRWPENSGAAEKALTVLQRELSPPVWRSLLTACVAAALGRSWEEKARDLMVLVERFGTPSDLGLTMDWRAMRQAGWALVALPTVQGPKATILWALVGSIPGETTLQGPSWLWPMMDTQAQEALKRAHDIFLLKTSQAMIFLPLIPSAMPNRWIRGPSWALPAYLGAWEAHLNPSERRQSGHLVATGDIDRQGQILPVGSVKNKAKAAAKAGFFGLLCACGSQEASRSFDGLHLIDVRDVQAAEYIWEMEALGAAKASMKDLNRLRSPKELVSGLRSLDPRIRGWSGFAATYAQTVQKVLHDPHDAENFVDALEQLFSDASKDVGWLQTLLAPIDKRAVQQLAKTSYLASYRLAYLHWTVAMQRGDVEQARCWDHCCRNYSSKSLAVYPDGIYRIADRLNRRFIMEYHSLYRFEPDLPKWVTAIRDRLESLREAQAVDGLKPAMPSLGKLYGTIAQNYGFCGPAYLNDCVAAVSRAWDAFGGDKVPELANERLRQYHYLVCAYLDAGDVHKAHEALERYLGGPLQAVVPDCLSSYQHAALARFLAETGLVHSNYETWCRGKLDGTPTEHPWQLWLWNVGRWVSRKEEKAKAWRRGLELCAQLGVTARPMALLHAAWLFRENLESFTFLEGEVDRVFTDVKGSRLSERHFASLLAQPSWSSVLESVMREPTRWFPFTYR
ncbi:hypothetical protein [Desulfosoma caldarium]|uniref:Uncharacterized protein n=1 Tax=Desulfosoma caldarium TaxID=610254 RepID=A0A3N1ULG7_9BACT|nr:hypothetical protein [Desulfosoma caldarium]ROQ92072.1 hypothetical protein EDC27_1744 [Desulfosoma caldarium]